MEALLAHCAAAFSHHGSMFAVFFLGGLTGSVTHCLAMCGPVVACKAACGHSCSKPGVNASQLSYHLGRFLTYGALGFAVALVSQQFAGSHAWSIISSLMLGLAGLMFIASSFPRSKHPLLKISATTNFMHGVLMGFMPCGLLYAALMMAATLANPISGMVAMWFFVLGTLPVLLLTSSGAALLAHKWQRGMNQVGRAAMAFNGVALCALAVTHVR